MKHCTIIVGRTRLEINHPTDWSPEEKIATSSVYLSPEVMAALKAWDSSDETEGLFHFDLEGNPVEPN